MKNLALFEEFKFKEPRYTEDEIESAITSAEANWPELITINIDKVNLDFSYGTKITEIDEFKNGFTFSTDEWYIETDEAIIFDEEKILESIKKEFDQIEREPSDLEDLVSDLESVGFKDKRATWEEIKNSILKVLNSPIRSSIVLGIGPEDFNYEVSSDFLGPNLKISAWVTELIDGSDIELDLQELSDTAISHLFYRSK